LILGLEHVTAGAMVPLFNQGIENDVTQRARALLEKCAAADADGLVFVNGFSDKPVDEFLSSMLDANDDENFSLAGIDLEHTEIFRDADLMRALREAVPFAARTQSPTGDYVYKGHTDANVRLNADAVANSMRMFWTANQDYVASVQQYFDKHEAVRGEILIYGHMNPYGVDPHNRVTFACDDKQAFDKAVNDVDKLREHFFRAVRDICQTTGSQLIGGEKGAASEREIYLAFGGPQNAPHHLQQKFAQQSARVAEASVMFNWRVLSPYG
jgi:hypothetical protein